MTFKEKLVTERSWYKKALIVNFYHNSRLLSDKRWSMRKTAQKLGISLGAASEAIKLCKILLDDNSLKECKTRKEALIRISGAKRKNVKQT